MNSEGSRFDQKSIRYVMDKHKDADCLACDCVGFANADGGIIFIGIEDSKKLPPVNQRIQHDLPEKLCKRIRQITMNVAILTEKRVAINGGEYIQMQVMPNRQSIASTTDGRYFIRVADGA